MPDHTRTSPARPADADSLGPPQGLAAAVPDPRPTSAPRASVVVASNREIALLRQCLGALAPQCAKIGAELIVCRPPDAPDGPPDLNDFPGARLVAAPAGSDVPRLRGLGMAHAKGDIVALTEDHCVAEDGWLDSILLHARDNVDVVGGGMGNGRPERAMDWAAYFAEYGFFSATRPPSDGAPLLTGANVAYRRTVVDRVITWAQRGEWEDVAHARLLAGGSRLAFARTASMVQVNSYRFGAFCRDRYEHGFAYARKRLAEGAPRRWLLLGGTLILPWLLCWRVARAAAGGQPWAFVRALPLTFAFLTAWSVGEAAGYLAGPAAQPAPTGTE